jgi:cobalamin synthase
MLQYVIKILITAILVVAISELAKRSSFWGAALASLPLTSVLAFVWLYHDSGSTQRVAELSQGVFWLVIPSLTLFLVLPPLLRSGIGFWLSLGVACVATVVAYVGMGWCLGRFGIRV